MTADRPREKPERGAGARTTCSRCAWTTRCSNDLQRLATRDGVSPSEWVRRAIAAAAFEAGRAADLPGFRHQGWQCDHVQITAGNVVLGAASCGQGCEMLPLYELAA